MGTELVMAILAKATEAQEAEAVGRRPAQRWSCQLVVDAVAATVPVAMASVGAA